MEKRHLFGLWILIQTYENYFDDTLQIKTFKDFKRWFGEKVIDGLVGVSIETGEIIGCAYIDNLENNNGRLNVFMKWKAMDFSDMINLFKEYLGFFLDKHNLKMLYGVVRVDNKACIQILKRLNFKINTDILTAHEYVNNKPIDCLIATYSRNYGVLK